MVKPLTADQLIETGKLLHAITGERSVVCLIVTDGKVQLISNLPQEAVMSLLEHCALHGEETDGPGIRFKATSDA